LIREGSLPFITSNPKMNNGATMYFPWLWKTTRHKNTDHQRLDPIGETDSAPAITPHGTAA
jgi:hypothetical protein